MIAKILGIIVKNIAELKNFTGGSLSTRAIILDLVKQEGGSTIRNVRNCHHFGFELENKIHYYLIFSLITAC